MSTVYSGPPSGLKLKLTRARRQISNLRRTIARFEASNPYALSRVVDAQGTHYLYSPVISDPPDSIMFTADEAVHHMRSVLDHLVVALVESAGERVTDAHAFPIRREKPTTDKEIARYDAHLKHVPAWARAIIDGAQPYTRGKDAKSHPLALLARLDNRFKHTTLHLLTQQVRWPVVPGAIRPTPQTRPFQEAEPFVAVPIDCDVEKDFEPKISVGIAFRIRDVGQPDINIDTLDDIYEFVRNEVMGRCLQLRKMPPLRKRESGIAAFASPVLGEGYLT